MLGTNIFEILFCSFVGIFALFVLCFWGLLRFFSQVLEKQKEHYEHERQDFVRTTECALRGIEESHRSALAHLSARTPKDAAESIALLDHQREALRQSAEFFDKEMSAPKEEPPPEKTILRDIHGNEFEIIGGN